MIAWLQRDGEADSYRVSKLLENPMSWDQFTVRARRLLAHAESRQLVSDLICAREPMSWSGSRVPYLQASREEYAAWCDDADARLAETGRAALNRFDQMIEREREREAREDDGWKWLRPASRS